uniref:Uncharacterized protein n=1 Tax=viral metagenome TaxID=1070528 RepID=A0A6C0D1A6_9ZZZZ
MSNQRRLTRRQLQTKVGKLIAESDVESALKILTNEPNMDEPLRMTRLTNIAKSYHRMNDLEKETEVHDIIRTKPWIYYVDYTDDPKTKHPVNASLSRSKLLLYVNKILGILGLCMGIAYSGYTGIYVDFVKIKEDKEFRPLFFLKTVLLMSVSLYLFFYHSLSFVMTKIERHIELFILYLLYLFLFLNYQITFYTIITTSKYRKH